MVDLRRIYFQKDKSYKMDMWVSWDGVSVFRSIYTYIYVYICSFLVIVCVKFWNETINLLHLEVSIRIGCYLHHTLAYISYVQDEYIHIYKHVSWSYSFNSPVNLSLKHSKFLYLHEHLTQQSQPYWRPLSILPTESIGIVYYISKNLLNYIFCLN